MILGPLKEHLVADLNLQEMWLALNDNRFQVDVTYTAHGRGGAGDAVDGTEDSGYFWFFSPDNLELVVKVLDARDTNGHFWVFFGAFSDVDYTTTVTDTVAGSQRTCHNSQGSQCGLPDTEAF